MSNIRHHPGEATLADFAAGRLDEARSVVVAAHIGVCGDCAAAVSDYEAMGGLALENIEPVAMVPDGLEKVLQRADASANVVLREAPKAADDMPAALRPYLKGSLDDIEWKTVAPGFSQCVLNAQGYRRGVLRLFKIAPGVAVPHHSHTGNEMTMILRGAYEDELGRFAEGDFADLDGDHTHTPKAVGDEPCICLIAADAPLAFKTLIGRVVQPFIKL